MKHPRLVLLLALATIAAGNAPTSWADPPPWAPAHGWRAKHHYTYYPHGEIYYAPESRMWFWLGGDGWQAGVSLPLDLRGYVRTGGISVDLDVDRPYLRHDYVSGRYGGQPVRHRSYSDDDRRGDRDDRDSGRRNNGRDHGHRGHDR